jgi:hypothetical protein
MRTVLLGLLLALLVAYPHLAVAAAVPAIAWLAGQPIVWAFAAGLLARPRITRRLTRSSP